MSAPTLSSITPELLDVGLLIGLLTGTESNPSFNSDWFSNPLTGFDNGFNWPNLQPLIEHVLGKAANPITADTSLLDETWYSIKINDDKGSPTDSGFYFVEKTNGNYANLGVGAEKTFTTTIEGETITIQPFVYVPVFTMPNQAGATPLFSLDTKGPVELGVEVTFSGTFSQSGTAYNGMVFVASFDFSATTPALTFMLKEPGGTYVNADTANTTSVFNTILGLSPVVSFLDSNVLPSSSSVNFTWGTLFNITGWLATASSPYTVGTISIPTTPGALETYVINVLFNAINKFLGQNTIIPIISKTTTDGPTWSVNLILNNNQYGINIQVSDITVLTNPQVNLQIGALTKDGTNWIQEAGGGTPEGEGLNFYLLSGTAPNISFTPGFELISAGFDIQNSNGQPLFNINGFALNEAQLRGYYSSVNNNAWGVAAAIDGISLPVVPPSASSADSVPATLMSAASSDGNSGDQKPAVNPEFSFITAYVSSFYFQLFDANDKPENIVVIPIQKAFGPVELKDIGIGWNNSSYQLLFQLDGSLNLNALNVELDKLTIGLPVQTPGDLSTYSLDLDGMEISFSSGDVTMAGGFLKDTSVTPTEYNGAVSIQAGAWGITALGSFASLNGSPSMFIFGVLNAELGGPPFFFVIGAAVGFGYNRQIIMPTIDNVVNFPFVQAAENPSLFSGQSPDTVLDAISTYIPPQLGEYWLAAGVKFTSFELLNSFALLMIEFGKEFEVSVLGTSTISLPKEGEGTTYAYAELELEAIFDPSQGVLSVQAQLTGNSYVIDPACVLSGGFAFFSWFEGSPYAGDFVVTLGGYNAAFVPPSYYPTVPRLGFNWNVSGSITISGDAYFALTPSCVMAGGKLSLVYSDGDLNAWFDAWADFLISWKPFHYDISIGLSIGVSYRLNLLFTHTTISVSLGIQVEIYGPDFGGTAYVSFYIVSFTISFGASPNPPKAVQWADFQTYFLPQPNSSSKTKLPGGDDDASTQVVKINTNSGLSDTFNYNGTAIWIVDPMTFSFNTSSAVPATQIGFAPGPGGTSDAPNPIDCNPFGVRPVGSMTLSGTDSLHYLTVTKQDENDNNYSAYSVKNWAFSTSAKNVPQALWGTVNDGSETPSAASVPDITAGLSSAGPVVPGLTGPGYFPILNLAYTNVENLNLPLPQGTAASVTLSSNDSITQIANTLYDTNTQSNQCTPLFNALQQVGSLASQNDSMLMMAQSANDIFQGSPMLAGSQNTVAQKTTARKSRMTMRGSIHKDASAETGKKSHELTTVIFNYNFGGDTVSSYIESNVGEKNKGLSARFSHLTNEAKADGFKMQPGEVRIWRLSGTDARDEISYDGKLPLRILFFDKNIELISEELTGKAGKIKLPQNAAHMVLRVLNGQEGHGLSGWNSSSSLPLLSPKYLMGTGCLVRPMSPHRTGRKQFSRGTGVSTGSRVVSKNSHRNQGHIAYGWTETQFRRGIKEIFVIGRAPGTSAIANALTVKVIYRDSKLKKQALVLKKAGEGQVGNEFWHRFTIPADLDAAYFSVWVQAADDIAVSGVAGAENAIETLSAELFSSLSKHESALGYDNLDASTIITLK